MPFLELRANAYTWPTLRFPKLSRHVSPLSPYILILPDTFPLMVSCTTTSAICPLMDSTLPIMITAELGDISRKGPPNEHEQATALPDNAKANNKVATVNNLFFIAERLSKKIRQNRKRFKVFRTGGRSRCLLTLR